MLTGENKSKIDKIWDAFCSGGISDPLRVVEQILRAAKQTTGIASIYSTQLKNFPVLIPSLDLQKRFAKSVVSTQKLKND